MPEALAPVDTSVAVPASVRQAAEAAEALHKAAYPQSNGEAPPEQPQPQQQELPLEQPPAPPVQEPPRAPEPDHRSVPETGETGSWEHRYLAMKGRFDQSQLSLGQMQEQLSQLGDELMRTQQALQMARAGLAGTPQQPQQRQQKPRTITEQDVETYGPELVDFVTRAARGAVAPDLDQVAQQVRQTTQHVRQTAQERMEMALDARLPEWRAINDSARFKQWVGLRDIYSGQVRRNLILDAAKAADAPRVAAFFQAFLAEERATGQLPDEQPQPPAPPAPRQAAVSLDSLATPGRAKPASGNGYAGAADKPVITRAQISEFYARVRRGEYAGRDQDKDRDEAAIYAAQREGRVR